MEVSLPVETMPFRLAVSLCGCGSATRCTPMTAQRICGAWPRRWRSGAKLAAPPLTVPNGKAAGRRSQLARRCPLCPVLLPPTPTLRTSDFGFRVHPGSSRLE